jgi:hypothetical protein
LKTLLTVLALIWIGSNLAMVLGVAGLWLTKRRKSELPERQRHATEPQPQRTRGLDPDPGLLVPWSAVRESKARPEPGAPPTKAVDDEEEEASITPEHEVPAETGLIHFTRFKRRKQSDERSDDRSKVG